MNLEDPDQVIALAADLERLGYYESPLQTILKDIVEYLSNAAMEAAIQGLPDPTTAVHYNRGLMNGARAVVVTLETVRMRALATLEKKKRDQDKEIAERRMPLGGGTLS